MNQYLQRAQQMAAEIVENRRYIHSHAGVGFDVGDTVDRIMSQLVEAGIQGEVCGQAGVVVTLGKPGKTILLRGDIDALPMPEQSGLTFYGAVCRDEDWKRITVVMLSAVPISVREHAFATIGLTQGPLPAPAACLEKPCTPEALLEVVNRLVPEPTTA